MNVTDTFCIFPPFFINRIIVKLCAVLSIVFSTLVCVAMATNCLSFSSFQVTEFTEKVNSYVMNSVMFYKSMWPEIKCNAALFVGKSTHTTLSVHLLLVVLLLLLPENDDPLPIQT